MFDRDYTRTHAAKASRAGLTLWWYMVSRGLNREPNLKPIRNLPSGDGLRNELARTKQIVACQENLGRIAIFTITILWINPCRTREVTIFLQIICILEINVLIFRSVGSGCLVVVPLELRPGRQDSCYSARHFGGVVPNSRVAVPATSSLPTRNTPRFFRYSFTSRFCSQEMVCKFVIYAKAVGARLSVRGFSPPSLFASSFFPAAGRRKPFRPSPASMGCPARPATRRGPS